jgi:nicotinate-nucleotide adenylyltransferase
METSAHDRLEMVTAAIAGDPRLTVDNCEIRREGVSYTVDTVADIIRRYAPEGKPGLIIGDDLAEDFPRWRGSDEILAMADIIIARRSHSGELNLPYKNTCIANEIMEISSGRIREGIANSEANSKAVGKTAGRAAAGAAWHYLVPAAARAIIEDRRLYDIYLPPVKLLAGPPVMTPAEILSTAGLSSRLPARPPAGLSASPQTMPPTLPQTGIKSLISHVEESARESLTLERFLHSRNVALMAWDLCRRLSVYRLDPDMGYLAGIAHDLGKHLNEKEMLRMAKKDGKKITPMEKGRPSLLHGRASAVLLKERFNVHNEAVLEAAARHTGGGKNMGPLAKVIYIADKMEFSREKADPAVRKLVYAGEDLDRIFFAVLDQNVSWLRTRKIKLSEGTLGLLEKMRSLSK